MWRLRFWILGLAGLLLIAEAVLRALPVPTATRSGYYIDPLILTYPPGQSWQSATGWDLRNPQWNESNNLGFVAGRDFVRDPDAVALIGDSYVEASMLDAADRPGAQLERELQSRPVYAMSGPGSSLLDYAERIRYAAEQLGVRDFVVLMERWDVRQSFCGSGNIHGVCLQKDTLALRTERRDEPGTLRKLLRHSAFAQYFAGQLRVSPGRLWQQTWAQARPAAGAAGAPDGGGGSRSSSPEKARLERAQDAVAQAFFDRIRPYLTGRLVIVLDSDRKALSRGQPTRDEERQRFMVSARANGAVVIDTEPLYRAHFAVSPLSLDVSPQDGHLNALGVGIVSRAAANALPGERGGLLLSAATSHSSLFTNDF